MMTSNIGLSEERVVLVTGASFFEPRIQHVIAYDVCYDGFEVMTRPMPFPLRQLFQLLVRTHARSAVNSLIERLRKRSLLLDWGVAQVCTSLAPKRLSSVTRN